MRPYPLLCLILVCASCTNETFVEVPQDGGEDDVPKIRGNQSQPNTLFTGNAQPVNALQINVVEPDGTPVSGSLTVQFAVQAPTAPGSNGVFATEAIVSWTISSNRVNRRISIANGVSITGVGEGVTVQLVDHTADGVTVPPTVLGAKYGVDVQGGLGVRGSIAQLPTLQEFANMNVTIPPSGGRNFAIPQDAGVIAAQILISSTEANDSIIANVVFQAVASSFATQFSLTAGTTAMIPIPPGTNSVAISNKDAADQIVASVIWGIDG